MIKLPSLPNLPVLRLPDVRALARRLRLRAKAEDPAAPAAAEDRPPLRQRIVQVLLYGQVDRNAKARARVGLAILLFASIYGVIAGRLILHALISESHVAKRVGSPDAVATARPEIIDRRGVVLATDVPASSLFGDPRRIIDADEAVELLSAVLPDLDVKEARDRLSAKHRSFVWLKREITPKQQKDVYKLGLPGIGFLQENKRTYPDGAEVAHLIGLVNVDNQGIAGIEKWLDTNGLADLHAAGLATTRDQAPVQLALDLRVQHALRDELVAAKGRYKALAAAGLVIDVRSGEIIAMVSVPDFDPNNPKEVKDPTRINRLTTGVFEMGSTFKALTFAMALDSGKITLNSSFDARGSLRYGKFAIHDYHGKNRVLSVPEIFKYSSNIGTARMALAMGVEAHQAFLRKVGQLDRLRTELPESADPIVPKRWGELNTVTIAFGHGLSVAPLQAVMAVSSLVNGGLLIPPTFMKRTEAEARAVAKRVIKPETSAMMRYLMRLNAESGTATKGDVWGFYVGGKTGTAEKVVHGRYSKTKLLTSFTAILPADKPQYQVLIMIDEPTPSAETHGYATSGWNAVPTAAKVISRIAPMLGLEPRFDMPPADQFLLPVAQQKTAAR